MKTYNPRLLAYCRHLKEEPAAVMARKGWAVEFRIWIWEMMKAAPGDVVQGGHIIDQDGFTKYLEEATLCK